MSAARKLQAQAAPRAKLLVDRCAASRVFSAALARLRIERGWSYERLAQVLDVARTDAFRLCNGGRATAEQVAKVVMLCSRSMENKEKTSV